jgi:tRNA C32,U32 (ribose-2'-O)-methylase TrmJ
MAEYDLQQELKDTIAKYKMLGRAFEHDAATKHEIDELVRELEEQLRDTEYPLAPKQHGDR